VQMLPWGMNNYQDAIDGMKMLRGDSIKTLKNAKTTIKVFNGIILRMDEDTELYLRDISDKSYKTSLSFNLKNGRVWINAAKLSSETDMKIYTNDLIVKSGGGIFGIEQNNNEIVRSMKGFADVDIVYYQNEELNVYDTVKVGIGQEISIGKKEINLYNQNKYPDVLDALSDKFKQEEWYSRNIAQDALLMR